MLVYMVNYWVRGLVDCCWLFIVLLVWGLVLVLWCCFWCDCWMLVGCVGDGYVGRSLGLVCRGLLIVVGILVWWCRLVRFCRVFLIVLVLVLCLSVGGVLLVLGRSWCRVGRGLVLSRWLIGLVCCSLRCWGRLLVVV